MWRCSTLLVVFVHLLRVSATLCPANSDACVCPEGITVEGVQCRKLTCLSSPSNCFVINSFPSADVVTSSLDSCEASNNSQSIGKSNSGTLKSNDGVGLFEWELSTHYLQKHISAVSFQFSHSDTTAPTLLTFTSPQSNNTFSEDDLDCLDSLENLELLPDMDQKFAEMFVDSAGSNQWVTNSLDVTQQFVSSLPSSRFQIAVTASSTVTLATKESLPRFPSLRMEIYSPPTFQPRRGRIQLKEDFDSNSSQFMGSTSWTIKEGSPFGGKGIFCANGGVDFLSQLYSPWITLPTANYQLVFKHFLRSNSGGAFLEFRTPNQEWTDAAVLMESGGYHNQFRSRIVARPRPAWTRKNVPIFTTINLHTFGEETIQFRWSWAHEANERSGGWWIDSIEVSDPCGNGIVETGEECDQSPGCSLSCFCMKGYEAKDGNCISILVKESANPTRDRLRNLNAADNCENAVAFPLGNHIGSTFWFSFSGVPYSCDVPGTPPDSWYGFEALFRGNLILSTCESDLDTVLHLYSSCSSSPLACNDEAATTSEPYFCCPDDFSCGSQSYIKYLVDPGFYYIRVNPHGQGGEYILTIDFEVELNPSDTCQEAIPHPPGIYSGDTIDQTASDVNFGTCSPYNSVDAWYGFKTQIPGHISANTCGTSYDTVLALYGNNCQEGLTCNDDSSLCPNSLNSQIDYRLEPGFYYLRFSPYSDDNSGPYSLNISFVGVETQAMPLNGANFSPNTRIRVTVNVHVDQQRETDFLLTVNLNSGMVINQSPPPTVNGNFAQFNDFSETFLQIQFFDKRKEVISLVFEATIRECNEENVLRILSSLESSAGWIEWFPYDLTCVEERTFTCSRDSQAPLSALASGFMNGLAGSQVQSDQNFYSRAEQYRTHSPNLAKFPMLRYFIPNMEVTLPVAIQKDEPLLVNSITHELEDSVSPLPFIRMRMESEIAKWIPIFDTETGKTIVGYRLDM